MTDALRVLFAVALPWLAGAALLHGTLARAGVRDGWTSVGYGHFAGVLLVTLLMRAFDAVGLGLAVTPVALVLVVIAALGAWLAHTSPAAQPAAPSVAVADGGRLLNVVVAIALALLAVRFATLAIEVVLRPLYPWDAWSQWATKARAWAGVREIVPFIGYEAWLAREPGYTDTAPHYPATIPLLQAWVALVLGRWDDAWINLPWLAAWVALGIGLHAQLRRLGVPAAWSAVATYLALSLPLLDVHVALAGYADLHLAAAYALGLLALAEWEASRSRASLWLLAAAAALLPLLKVPGIAWLGTLL